MTHVYDPFPADLTTEVAGDLEHTVSAQIVSGASTVEVTVVRGSLTMDEAWSPFVQADVTVVAPTDAATLALIDPRKGARLVLTLGYRRLSGELVTGTPFDLGLRARPRSLPGGEMQLQAASDEALVSDYLGVDDFHLTVASTPVGVGALSYVQFALGFGITYTDTTPGAATIGADMSCGSADDPWDFAVEAADRGGAQLWCDGARTWHVAPAVAVLDTTDYTTLATGPGRTVTSVQDSLTREGDADSWYNAVIIKYAGGYYRYAIQTTGDFADGTVPRRALYVDRTQIAQPASGDHTPAQSILARAITRGQTTKVTALAAYWLQPRQTVYLDLPGRDPGYELVSRVTFDLAGTMTVDTRSL